MWKDGWRSIILHSINQSKILFQSNDQLDIISAESGKDGFLIANSDKRFWIDAKYAKGAASESDRIAIPELEVDSLACWMPWSPQSWIWNCSEKKSWISCQRLHRIELLARLLSISTCKFALKSLNLASFCSVIRNLFCRNVEVYSLFATAEPKS